jgi:uncharacterized protein YrrD
VKVQIYGVVFVDEACFSVRDSQDKVFDISVNKGTVSEDGYFLTVIKLFSICSLNVCCAVPELVEPVFAKTNLKKTEKKVYSFGSVL